MWSLVKLLTIMFVGYAVITAPPQDQAAMAQGLKAFGRSVASACERPASPCSQLLDALRPIATHLIYGQPLSSDLRDYPSVTRSSH